MKGYVGVRLLQIFQARKISAPRDISIKMARENAPGSVEKNRSTVSFKLVIWNLNLAQNVPFLEAPDKPIAENERRL